MNKKTFIGLKGLADHVDMKRGVYHGCNTTLHIEWDEFVKDFGCEPNVIKCEAPLVDPVAFEGIMPEWFGSSVKGFGFRKGYSDGR